MEKITIKVGDKLERLEGPEKGWIFEVAEVGSCPGDPKLKADGVCRRCMGTHFKPSWSIYWHCTDSKGWKKL